MTRRAFIFQQKPGQVDRLDHALDNDVIVIGWSEEVGLTDTNLTYNDFRIRLNQRYYEDRENNSAAGKAATNMWRFIRDTKIDDIIIVSSSNGLHVAEVTDKAYYDPEYLTLDMAYRRPVNWLTKNNPIPFSDIPPNLAQAVSLGRHTSREISQHLPEIMIALSSVIKGNVWSHAELRYVVQSYFEMLKLEIAGEKYVKKEHRQRLLDYIPRGEKSIEFKYQNISAALSKLGLSYIQGYKPKYHIQISIVDIIEKFLTSPKSYSDVTIDRDNEPIKNIISESELGSGLIKATILQ